VVDSDDEQAPDVAAAAEGAPEPAGEDEGAQDEGGEDELTAEPVEPDDAE
jgi:hypothetical protein